MARAEQLRSGEMGVDRKVERKREGCRGAAWLRSLDGKGRSSEMVHGSMEEIKMLTGRLASIHRKSF